MSSVENDSPATIARRKLNARSAKQTFRGISNVEFSKTDTFFQEACSKAGISPTARQASRFRSKKGLAYQNRKL